MNIDFNNWWDEDVLTEDNPFNGGTPAYWAWEGWCAGVKAEREACANAVEQAKVQQFIWYPNGSSIDANKIGDIYKYQHDRCIEAIRERDNT